MAFTGVAALFAWRATHWAKEAAKQAGISARADNLALDETRQAAVDARKDADVQTKRFTEQMAKQQELVDFTATTALAMETAATAQQEAAGAMRESAEIAQQGLAHTMAQARAQASQAKAQLALQDRIMIETARTASAMQDSARAASRNANAIPILERAYVHSEVTAEYTVNALYGATTPASGFSAEPTVTLRFKNFGKTPATLVHGEVFFSLADGKTRGGETKQWPIEYQQVLGAGEATFPFQWDLGFGLTSHEALTVKNGDAKLRLWGFLKYLDVFGNDQQCDIGWTYNSALKRMTPDAPKPNQQGRSPLHKR